MSDLQIEISTPVLTVKAKCLICDVTHTVGESRRELVSLCLGGFEQPICTKCFDLLLTEDEPMLDLFCDFSGFPLPARAMAECLREKADHLRRQAHLVDQLVGAIERRDDIPARRISS